MSSPVDQKTALQQPPLSRPNLTLVVAAALLFAICVVAVVEDEPGLATAFATLALASVIVAVFQPHVHNVKAGPKGFEIETVRREEVRLTAQLREHLGGVGTVDLAEVRPRGMRDDHLHGLSESLAILQFTAEEKAEGGYSPAPSAQLELARAALAEQAWDHAAGLLERYTRTRPEDWEAQYARGVAHANSRIGRDADIRALQAYSDAISFLPRAHAKTWLSRLYAYRGGMLKRLCRYEEALNDLRLARHLASDGDDRNDISYNFACVYAMSGDTGAALREVRSLIDTPYIEAIAAHRHDYFASLADNSEFQAIVGVHSPTDATR